MTDTPVLQPGAPAKKPGNPHPLITIALVALIILVAILAIFGGPIFDALAGSNDQSVPAVVPAVSTPAIVPVAPEIPTAEIDSKSVTCQVTGSLDITGAVTSNVAHPLYVVISGTGYDSTGVELGTGYDSVNIDPYGTSPYKIDIIDGCQLGDSGTYDVRISDISWRHLS
jgi:hypothetical protein